MMQTVTPNTPRIDNETIKDLMQIMEDKITRHCQVDTVIRAGIADYKRHAGENDRDLPHLTQLRAVARYAFLLGYGTAWATMKDAQEATQEPNGPRATGDGDFLYTVEGDGEAPAFVAGDVVTIRATACTPDLQTARGVVIRQGDRALIGRLVMYQDGSADLIHGGQLVPFDPERDFIGPVVAVWRALEPAAAAQE